MATRSPLGRGLASLLPTSAHTSGFQDLPIGAVQPDPDQPRKTFDEEALQQLAHSIEHAMIARVHRAGGGVWGSHAVDYTVQFRIVEALSFGAF